MQAKPAGIALMAGRVPSPEEHGSAPNVLLLRARAGDVEAFEELLRQSERRVLRTALRLLGNLEDAKDAAQEVFLRFHRHLPRLDPGRDLSPWFYRVTLNVCRDLARRRRIYQQGASDREIGVVSEDPVELAEKIKIAEEGLKTLSEKERAALVLRDIEGLSTREVARVLGSSEVTVRSQVSRARVKLKRFRDRILGRKP